MTDLERRLGEAQAIATDESLPKWQRVAKALQVFGGLELTGISCNARSALEADFVAVNRVLAGYRLKKVEHYQRISDFDLQQILDIVNALASRVAAPE